MYHGESIYVLINVADYVTLIITRDDNVVVSQNWVCTKRDLIKTFVI